MTTSPAESPRPDGRVAEVGGRVPEPGAAGPAVVFCAPADPDERTAAVRSKLAWIDSGRGSFDLLAAVLSAGDRPTQAPVGPPPLGSEWDWLSPTPAPAHRDRMSEASFAGFVDEGGCGRLADAIQGYVARSVLPAAPFMVGVDHSLTGGALRALAGAYGAADLAVVVFDNHTDAVPTAATAGAVRYDAETNPRSVHDLADPLLSGRPDSYNASTFLHHLVAEGTLDPRNLYLVGVADTPPSRARKIADPRIQEYVEAYSGLRRLGVTVLTQEEAAANPARVGWELRRNRAAHVYLSVDLDIGADSATRAVRFRDRRGLDAALVERLVEEALGALAGRARLVGGDVMEFDVRVLAAGDAPDGRTGDGGAIHGGPGGDAPAAGAVLAARILSRLLEAAAALPADSAAAVVAASAAPLRSAALDGPVSASAPCPKTTSTSREGRR